MPSKLPRVLSIVPFGGINKSPYQLMTIEVLRFCRDPSPAIARRLIAITNTAVVRWTLETEERTGL
jgi:hypothetical protein